MTRSADSSAPAHEIPQPLEHTWRRLFVAENVRAKTIPRGEMHAPSTTPAKSGSSNLVVIGAKDQSQRDAQLGAPFVQPRVVTTAESCAKKAIETLVEPFTYEQVSRLPGWNYSRAKHWLRKLKAKGELRATLRGHFKTEAWRR